MCAICRQVPCHPRCPNAPEPEPVHRCRNCGYGIFPGDEFLDSPDGCICKDCLDDMSLEELIGLFGESLSTA